MNGLISALTALYLLVAVSLASAGQIPNSERQALIALFGATGGDRWSKNDDWLSENSHVPADKGTECEWHGISCNDDQTHVIGVDLSANQLVGIIPNAIGQLLQLERLDLADNRLTGELPRGLWNLRHLQRLDLSGNRLSGRLPRGLGALRRLEVLDLSRNRLSASIPAELGSCTGLQHLSLAENRFTGPLPDSLSALKHLVDLDLSNNQLSGYMPASWQRLRELRVLNLDLNQLRGSLPARWSQLRQLVLLNLDDNRLSGSLPPWLFALPSLGALSLSNNRFSGSWILPAQVGGSLNYLDLSHNTLNGPLPAGIDRLSELNHIDISHNRFSGPLPSTLFSAAPQVLRANHNRLSGSLPRLDAWPATLDLSHNQLTGVIDPSADADRLEWFSVAHNQLTGALPLAVLSSDARAIDVSDNRFTGGLPPEWKTSSSIAVLNLSHNQLTGPLPPDLFAGEELLWVDVSSNRFSGVIPEVTGAAALQVLRVADNDLTGTLPVNDRVTPWLAWLSVERNHFQAGLTEVLGLKSLQAFDGEENPWADAPPTDLARLPKTVPRDFVVVNARALLRPQASGLAREDRADSPTSRPTTTGRGLSLTRVSFQTPAPQGLVISGVVTDSLGGVIPGATVTAVAADGRAVSAVSGPDGRFVIPVPQPGEYRLRAELSGFAVITQTVAVGAGQTQDVRVVFNVGSQTETISVEAQDRSSARAWWNGWISEPEDETTVPARLTPGRAYQFVLEVGSTSARHANGVSSQISSRLADHIAERLRRHESKIPLTVRLFIIGRKLRLSPSPDRLAEWRDGRWVHAVREQNTAILQLDIRRMARAQESPVVDETTPLPVERYGAVRLDVEAVEDGCSAIAASIWDGAQTVPLDQVVQIVSIGENARCEQYQGQTESTANPFGLAPYYTRAAASLHLFEFSLEGTPTAVALFAVRGAESTGCPIYAWQVAGTISGAVFKGQVFRDQLTRARTGEAENGYARVAALMRDALFRGRTQVTGCGAASALAALQKASVDGEVELLMRIVDATGRHLFPPVGVLSLLLGADGRPAFAHRIVAIESLANQSLGSGACVENWRFVLPEPLLDATPEMTTLPMGLQGDTQVIRSREGLETYLDSPDRREPAGLVLLAHYSDGYLTFANEDDVMGFQALAEIDLGPGSIAMLSACTAAAITDSSLLVESLNRAGVDAFVMSPFEIDANFGSALAMNLADEVARTTGAAATLGQLYRKALAATEKQLANHGDVVRGWASEFVIAGNPDASICRKRQNP
jgi:Leucine-rich repeat (LRR) protein